MTEQVQARAQSHRFGYRLAVLSDVGKRRSENQDAYAYAVSEKAALYLVADGMGGARGGATASALAVKHITDSAFGPDQSVDMERLRTAVAGANSLIYARSQQDANLFGMGTTVANLLVVGDRVILAHVGDSRIYLLRNGELKQLTKDHTLVQELVDTGTIAETDAAAHPIAHMLTRSLGPSEIIGVEARVFEEPLRGGERFMICSDGLYNHVSFDQIAAILKDGTPEKIAKNLIARALDGGGSDNVTALVLEISTDRSGPDILPIPVSGDITRIVSREIPTPGAETEYSGPENWTAESEDHANGHERHTTGFLRADDLHAYAEGQRAAAGNSDPTLRLPVTKGPGSSMMFAAGVLFLGVLAGVFFVSRHQSSTDPGNQAPIELASRDPKRIPPQPAQTSSPILIPPDDTHIVANPTLPPEVPAATPAPVETQLALIVEATPEPTAAPLATPQLLVTAPQETATPSNQGTVPAVTPSPVASLSSGSTVPATVSTAVAEQTLENIPPTIGDPTEIPISVVTTAFAMEIPAPPRLEGIELEKIPELGANSPIVWEHESQKVAKIQAEDRARRVNVVEERATSSSKTKIFTSEELKTAALGKDATRRRIAEIDGKIALLFLPSKADAKKKEAQTDKQIAQLKKGMQAKQAELNKWSIVLASWRTLKTQSLSTDTVQLAQTAEKFSPAIHDARIAFQKASESYVASLNHWQNQSLDTQGTSLLAQLGRDVKARRLELENSVHSGINQGFLEADRQVARLGIEYFGMERQKDLLVKFAGFVKGYAPVTARAQVELYRKYLGERANLLRDLKKLQSTLDDDAEIGFRLQQFSQPARA